MARNENDYRMAEESFGRALSQAESLSASERLMTLLELGDLFEKQGNYQAAGDTYKQALTVSPCNEAVVALAEILDLQNKTDESKALRAEHCQKPSRAVRDKWIGKFLQPAVARNWKIQIMTSQIPVVRLRVAPDAQAAAYLSESSGDVSVDAHSLAAIQKAIAVPSKSLSDPVLVTFGFWTDDRYAGFELSGFAGGLFVSPSANFRDGTATLRIQGKYHQLRRRVAAQEALLGLDHVEVAKTLTEAACLLSKQNQRESAIQAYKRAVEIFDHNHTISSSSMTSNYELGLLLLSAKRDSEAEPYLRKANTIARSIFPEGAEELVHSNEALMKLLFRLGRKPEAAQLNADSSTK